MSYKEHQLKYMKEVIVNLNKKGSNFRVCYLRYDDNNYNGHEFLKTTVPKIPEIGSTIQLEANDFVIKEIHGFQFYFTTPNDFIDIVVELKTDSIAN